MNKPIMGDLTKLFISSDVFVLILEGPVIQHIEQLVMRTMFPLVVMDIIYCIHIHKDNSTYWCEGVT